MLVGDIQTIEEEEDDSIVFYNKDLPVIYN